MKKSKIIYVAVGVGEGDGEGEGEGVGVGVGEGLGEGEGVGVLVGVGDGLGLGEGDGEGEGEGEGEILREGDGLELMLVSALVSNLFTSQNTAKVMRNEPTKTIKNNSHLGNLGLARIGGLIVIVG